MAAKTAIGEFYLAIDRNLRIRHSTNAYQFIDRIVSLSQPRTTLMKYGVEDIETIKKEVKKYVEDRQKLLGEFEKMKRERDKAKIELHFTQEALASALQEMKLVTTLVLAAQKQISCIHSACDINVIRRIEEIELQGIIILNALGLLV